MEEEAVLVVMERVLSRALSRVYLRTLAAPSADAEPPPLNP